MDAVDREVEIALACQGDVIEAINQLMMCATAGEAGRELAGAESLVGDRERLPATGRRVVRTDRCRCRVVGWRSMKYDSDVTLIDAMLALTPEERIDQNDRMLRTLEELRDGLARSEEPHRDARQSRG